MVTWLVAAPWPCQRAHGLARGALPFCPWERGGMRASCSVSWERGPERAPPWCCPHFAPEQHGCAHSLAQQPWIQTAAPGQTSTCQHPARTRGCTHVHTGMHKACAHTPTCTHTPTHTGRGCPPPAISLQVSSAREAATAPCTLASHSHVCLAICVSAHR